MWWSKTVLPASWLNHQLRTSQTLLSILSTVILLVDYKSQIRCRHSTRPSVSCIYCTYTHPRRNLCCWFEFEFDLIVLVAVTGRRSHVYPATSCPSWRTMVSVLPSTHVRHWVTQSWPHKLVSIHLQLPPIMSTLSQHIVPAWYRGRCWQALAPGPVCSRHWILAEIGNAEKYLFE